MPGTSRAATPGAPALPTGVTLAMIARGDSLYSHNACQRCHGPNGFNGPNGPALAKGDSARWLHSDGSFDGIVSTILAGVPRDRLVDKTRRFQMNPRGSNPPLSDDDVRAVAAYIWKLNHP
ncbi:MAG TPA: cytochrome c [Gemmatimonadaceae bacterium]|nr:cytochrome c [Gemmatimonadaceae bacterium]